VGTGRRAHTSVDGPEARAGASRQGGITIEANAAAIDPASASLARNSGFLLLWAGQFVSQIGDRLAMVAFPWLVYKSTGSALGTGAVFALYTLPYVLFGAFAGVVIDRFNKRAVMVAADVVRAGLVLVVPLAATWSLSAVYVLSFLMATAAVFFDPCKLAILPDLVAKNRLMRANSLLATGENLTEIVGYALAGFLLAYVSTATAFRIDSLTFAVSAIALLLMRYRAPVRAAAHRTARSFWHELREGLGFLRHHHALWMNTLMVVAFVAGLGASYPLTFLLAVRVLDAGTKAFGLFEAVIGVGYLVGSLALATLATRVRKGLAMAIGWVAMGVSLIVVAATGGVWQACIPFAVFGLANAVALIAVDTWLQDVVPERLRGRVFGARFTLTQGTYALSVLVGGALAGVFDVHVLFIVAGVLMAIPGIAALFVRDIREA
jgi:DHA3 family macrolide efflux protein-like MFS transporter